MRYLVAGFVLLFGLALGGTAISAPHVGTYLCPACYGFRTVAPHVFVDKDASDAQIKAALGSLETANAQVLGFYPKLVSRPTWLFCLSDACQTRYGRGPLAMAYLSAFVFVSAEGARVPILAHEIAHTELHRRVGMLRYLGGAVPAWFDEGLAVYISGDDRYLTLKRGQIVGCTGGDLTEPPNDARTFRHLAAKEARSLYTASVCKLVNWMEAHGAMTGVIQLQRAIRNGADFAE